MTLACGGCGQLSALDHTDYGPSLVKLEREGRMPDLAKAPGGREKQTRTSELRLATGEAQIAVTQTSDYERCIHEGVLSVTIVKAENVMPADDNGGSDPYVRAGVGGQEFVTGIKMDVDFAGGADSNSCAWNENFMFRVAHPADRLGALPPLPFPLPSPLTPPSRSSLRRLRTRHVDERWHRAGDLRL